MDFANLLKKTLRLLKAQKKFVDLICTNKKSKQIEDLVDNCEKNSQISYVTNYFTLLPKFLF